MPGVVDAPREENGDCPQSRVVRQAKRERNYHVFYYLVRGADPEERSRCFMQNKRCEDFYYLNQSGCTSIDGWNDEKSYNELKVWIGARQRARSCRPR